MIVEGYQCYWLLELVIPLGTYIVACILDPTYN